MVIHPVREDSDRQEPGLPSLRALFLPRTTPLRLPDSMADTPPEVLARQILASQALEGFEPAHSVEELIACIQQMTAGRGVQPEGRKGSSA